jgi:hypothetical protein
MVVRKTLETKQGFAPGHRNVNCLQDEKAENGRSTAKRTNEGTFVVGQSSQNVGPEKFH